MSPDLTAAELEAARAELDYNDEYSARAAFTFGYLGGILDSLLDGGLDLASDWQREHIRAARALVDEKPDRRTMLTLRLARAEKYLAEGKDTTGVWARAAVRYRAELATLDATTLPAGGVS